MIRKTARNKTLTSSSGRYHDSTGRNFITNLSVVPSWSVCTADPPTNVLHKTMQRFFFKIVQFKMMVAARYFFTLTHCNAFNADSRPTVILASERKTFAKIICLPLILLTNIAHLLAKIHPTKKITRFTASGQTLSGDQNRSIVAVQLYEYDYISDAIHQSTDWCLMPIVWII